LVVVTTVLPDGERSRRSFFNWSVQQDPGHSLTQGSPVQNWFGVVQLAKMMARARAACATLAPSPATIAKPMRHLATIVPARRRFHAATRMV
jgi:hypothetical protein